MCEFKDEKHQSEALICIVQFNYFALLAALTDKGKFLLAARRFRQGAHTEYIFSYDYDDLHPRSSSYVGKLR